jgi:hypothetical protein
MASFLQPSPHSLNIRNLSVVRILWFRARVVFSNPPGESRDVDPVFLQQTAGGTGGVQEGTCKMALADDLIALGSRLHRGLVKDMTKQRPQARTINRQGTARRFG